LSIWKAAKGKEKDALLWGDEVLFSEGRVGLIAGGVYGDFI